MLNIVPSSSRPVNKTGSSSVLSTSSDSLAVFSTMPLEFRFAFRSPWMAIRPHRDERERREATDVPASGETSSATAACRHQGPGCGRSHSGTRNRSRNSVASIRNRQWPRYLKERPEAAVRANCGMRTPMSPPTKSGTVSLLDRALCVVDQHFRTINSGRVPAQAASPRSRPRG